jgi:hypothetical protein
LIGGGSDVALLDRTQIRFEPALAARLVFLNRGCSGGALCGLVYRAAFFGGSGRGHCLLTITGTARNGQKDDCWKAGDNKVFHGVIFLKEARRMGIRRT